MSETLHIRTAEPVIHGVLKISWDDGYEAVVDLRGLSGKGGVFAQLRDPAFFRNVKVASYGHSIYWGEEGNELLDFGCDRLREMAEEQAAMLAHAI